jgi:hypothetical protein
VPVRRAEREGLCIRLHCILMASISFLQGAVRGDT